MTNRRQNSRIQVSDLRQRQDLRPAPITSDSFTGAPRIDNAGRNYLALAESLGHFSGSLRNLSTVQAQQREDGTALQNEVSRLTSSQQRDLARTGVLPSGRKLSDGPPGLLKATGRAVGMDFARELRHEMAQSFNWETGNIDEWVTERQNSHIDTSGISDPLAMRGFYDQMDQLRTWAEGEQERFRAERYQEYSDDVVFKNLRAEVFNGIEAGMTPDELPRHVRAAYAHLGKEGTIGMGYDKLDEWVMGLAQTIATQHPDHALALIDQPREGAGPASGPLSDKLTFMDRASRVRQTASKAKGELELAQEVARVHQNNAARIIEGGDYSRFQDMEVRSETTGERKTVTAAQQQERFTREVMQWGEVMMREGKVSHQVADRETLSILQRAGISHPYIAGEIDGIEKRFDISTQQDEAHMADIKERVDRYRHLEGVSRGYARSHLSEDTRDFMSAVDALIRHRHMDTERAIGIAQRVVSSDDGAMRRSFASHRDTTMVDAVHQAFDQRARFLGMRWGFGGSQTAADSFNMMSVTARVESVATAIFATGQFSIQEAIELAAEDIAATTPLYRGSVIIGLEQFPLHEEWTAGLDQIMENFELYAMPDPSREAMTIRHEGGGRLLVVDQDGIAVLNRDGGVLGTNVTEVNEEADKALRERQGKAIRDASEQQRRRQDSRRQTREANEHIDSFNPAVRPAPQRPSLMDDAHRGP